MTTRITYLAPIPPKTIVIWDAKYRKEGGTYPKFDNAKLARWKQEIRAAISSPGKPIIGRLTGSHLPHVNAQISEINAYRVLLENGHHGIQEPERTTAPGPDFITYYHGSPITGDPKILLLDALAANRIVGRIFRWPECIVTI